MAKKELGKLAKDRKRNLKLSVTEVDVDDEPMVHSFECRVRLSNEDEFYECRGDLAAQTNGRLRESVALATKLFDIDGIQDIEIIEYRVYVTISESFDWDMDEISMQAKEIITDYIVANFPNNLSADEIIDHINKKNKEK